MMRWYSWIMAGVLGALALVLLAGLGTPSAMPVAAQEKPAVRFEPGIRPILNKYCLQCHSTAKKRGSLDLERFSTEADLRKELKVWQSVVEQVEADEMPPKTHPQPTREERKALHNWVREYLDAEARARSGDPGFVPLRRLSNTEYDATIRDLTGVDLRPTREFPADGAGGEGFTNAAESLSEISPALLTKYLNAAKSIADHAVLLPDGIRFSPRKTPSDWTDELLVQLRSYYAEFVTGEGRLELAPYLAATVRHRQALLDGKTTPAAVASQERLNPQYFGILWNTLANKTPSPILDSIRAQWLQATPEELPGLLKTISTWQGALWKTVRIGNYIQPAGAGYIESLTRQVPVDPPVATTLPLRLTVQPQAGQRDVVVYLNSRDLSGVPGGQIVWEKPRFEASGQPPIDLRDVRELAPRFDVDYPSAFLNAQAYLAGVAELANDPTAKLEAVAMQRQLDTVLLDRWVNLLGLTPPKVDINKPTMPASKFKLLSERMPNDPGRPAIRGWRKAGAELPMIAANSSTELLQIPGRISPKGIAVHPMPQEFVAVAWTSPIAGEIQLTGRVAHAHPACGNGVAWWLEHQRAGQAVTLGQGTLDLGKEITFPTRQLTVAKGDTLLLGIDARDGSHVCDLTEIELKITEIEKPGRVWDLAADLVNDITAGNPHADQHKNAQTWKFGYGAGQPVSFADPIPKGSALDRWRTAAGNPTRQYDLPGLAKQVEAVLSGQTPAAEGSPDRLLVTRLVGPDGPLLRGLDARQYTKPHTQPLTFGLEKSRFGKGRDGQSISAESLMTELGEVTELRLPAGLFLGRELVVEARPVLTPKDRAVQVQLSTTPPPNSAWHPTVLAQPGSAGYQQVQADAARFREVFPLFLCFPPIVPVDEVVSLKMFHREDEPLNRLFLNADQVARGDRLWEELRFVSRQAVRERDYLPQFIGFVTQDQPKSMLAYFEGQRPVFARRAEEQLKQEAAAIPHHLKALEQFASRAYRRPLKPEEATNLQELYRESRTKGLSHEAALRNVLARVLIAPAFLFRLEQAPAGDKPAPVNDWELATRLSYFLWSSMPDEELRQLAAVGKLRDPAILKQQTRRMLADPRTRSLAIEFGTQWIHVRGFDSFNEKNEKLFPTFDTALRADLYEEAILFFQDLFQQDRQVLSLLDADYTFLNESLARHYGIPGVSGPAFRRVEGVRQYGRGGVLGLGSVQARQAGASRTSPTLRGNWVVETLLGEKLPRPPANVPQLPQEEGQDQLTMRQLVEKHAQSPECASCHVRIDPFGFALEAYDPIGRRREKDLGGLPIDARSKLKDGTEFVGVDGLRSYLLTAKKDVVLRLFCRRLLGYALGRSVTLSDTSLLDEMVRQLKQHDGRVSAVLDTIVRSPQFQMVRGQAFQD